jgi:hypothetical protein
VVTLPRERPDRLYQRDRLPDTVFTPVELLFRRYVRNQWVDGKFASTGFNLKEPCSVNRSKYSEPADALVNEEGRYERMGVLSFAVGNIPVTLRHNGNIFDFFPKHLPETNNYAHSEVWATLPQDRDNHVEPNPDIRKLFRAKLSQHVNVCIEAQL